MRKAGLDDYAPTVAFSEGYGREAAAGSTTAR